MRNWFRGQIEVKSRFSDGFAILNSEVLFDERDGEVVAIIKRDGHEVESRIKDEATLYRLMDDARYMFGEGSVYKRIYKDRQHVDQIEITKDFYLV